MSIKAISATPSKMSGTGTMSGLLDPIVVNASPEKKRKMRLEWLRAYRHRMRGDVCAACGVDAAVLWERGWELCSFRHLRLRRTGR